MGSDVYLRFLRATKGRIQRCRGSRATVRSARRESPRLSARQPRHSAPASCSSSGTGLPIRAHQEPACQETRCTIKQLPRATPPYEQASVSSCGSSLQRLSQDGGVACPPAISLSKYRDSPSVISSFGSSCHLHIGLRLRYNLGSTSGSDGKDLHHASV